MDELYEIVLLFYADQHMIITVKKEQLKEQLNLLSELMNEVVEKKLSKVVTFNFEHGSHSFRSDLLCAFYSRKPYIQEYAMKHANAAEKMATAFEKMIPPEDDWKKSE